MGFQILAEFLRFIGIYVCEHCLETADAVEGEAFSKDKSEGTFCFGIPHEESEVGHLANKERQKRLLKAFLGEAEEFISAENLYVYNKLMESFLENDLFIPGIIEQYFRMKDSVVEEAGYMFADAARKLRALQESEDILLNNRYVEYARIFCWQKANLAACLCQKEIAYYINELARDCLNLIHSFPDFSNAWVLLGFIYEFPNDRIGESLDAFERALAVIGKEVYASSVYYWAAKRCEGYRTLTEKKNFLYQKSYNLARKYRVIYKIAMKYEGNEEWNTAIKCFEDCIACIEQKGSYLDPLEQEYKFKVNVRISYIYIYSLNNYFAGIDHALKAIKIRENILKGFEKQNEDTKFCFDAFGEKLAKKYIKVSLDRMKTDQACRYLSKAYEKLNMREESLKYWEMSNKQM